MIDCYSDQEVLEKREIEGVRYRIVRRGKMIVAEVFCPKCGRRGKLTSMLQRTTTRKFAICHPEKRCIFGFTSEFYEIMRKIFEIKNKYISKYKMLLS